MRIHRWLDFKITARCDRYKAKCQYCAVPVRDPHSPELLSITKIHETLLDARALGFDTFWFLGGEPSLREDADQLFAPLSEELDVRLAVVTNGKTPNFSMYQALFATRCELAKVQVSLDSLAENNPKRSDPGQVELLIRELDEMAKEYSAGSHHCEVEVHAVVSRHNQTTFENFVEYFEALGIPVSLALVCPWSVCETPARLNEFTHAELHQIVRTLRRLQGRTRLGRFNDLIASFVEAHIAESSPRLHMHGCGAGLTHLVINSNGDVYRCMAHSFTGGTALGNIKDVRLHRLLAPVTEAMHCGMGSECFDGYAWDELAISG